MWFKRKTRKEVTPHEISLEYSIANYDPKRRIVFFNGPLDPNQVEEASNLSGKAEKELLERGLELIPSDPYDTNQSTQYTDGHVTATISRHRNIRDSRNIDGMITDIYSFLIKISSTDLASVQDLSKHLRNEFPQLEEIN